MDHYCHFHPNSPAKWRCNACNRLYDNVCVPQCNEKLHQASCPLCNEALIFIAAQAIPVNDIYPAKKLLLDSLDSKNLGLIAASVSLALLSAFFEFNSVLKLSLSLCLSLFLVLHFSRVSAYFKHLHQQTGKYRTPYRSKQKDSSLTAFSISTSIQLSLASAFLLLLPIYIFYSIHWFSGLVLVLFSGISFPYLIIFSLHSNDNEATISLAKLFKEIKPFTLNLSLTSLACYWLTLSVSDLTASVYPLVVTQGISALFIALSSIIVVNLASKIFIITERKLTVKAPKADIKGPTSIYSQESISRLDTDLDQSLKTGQYDKAVAFLEEAIKRNGNSNLRRQQLFFLLYELQDMEKLSRYAELFLSWMLERNRVKEASQFIYQLRKHEPAFLLHQLNLMNELAKQFLRAKKYALVLWLAEDAKVRHQPSEELASLYLSAAQALITHFNDLAKAEEYLLFILQSCSEYPSSEAAKALLMHLQNNQKKQQDLRE